jgi:hypothetical protein
MFEHRTHRVLPRPQFFRRVGGSLSIAGAVIVLSLAVGILGYRLTEGMPWVDSLLNASMILSGMGPVGELKHTGAKLFASAYALASGIIFIGTAGVLAAPWIHRLLHKLHAEEEPGEDEAV